MYASLLSEPDVFVSVFARKYLSENKMSHKTKSSVGPEHNSVGFSLDNESSVYLRSVLLDVEDVDKTYDDYRFSSETDESSSMLPSTPTYSNPSPHNMDSLSSSLGSAEVGPTNTRFVVIIIASIAFFLQIFSQSIWGAIYEPALLAFPNWTSRSLALLPIWGSVMTAAFVFPACLTINKYGLRVSLLWSCGFFTLGTAVRCLPSMHTSTLCLHLSALCLSAGGVTMTPLMITMSAQWFPKNERNMATGFGSTVGMLGSAATYVIGPRILSTDSGERLDPISTRNQIMDMLYACFGLNVFVTCLVYLFFPKHTRPVSYTSKMSMASHHSAKLFRSLGILVKDFDVWCLVLAFALSNTISAPWSALLPSTFSKLHVPPEISAQCGLFMILHTFAMSLTISKFADCTPGYSKELALFSRFVSLIFLCWLMFMLNFHAKLTTTTLVCVVLVAFPYGWCSQSLLYEMGVEMMFPLPESFVAGYMTLLNNLFVDFVYVVLYFFPRFDKYWMHIGVFVFSAVGVVFLLLTTGRGEKKRRDR